VAAATDPPRVATPGGSQFSLRPLSSKTRLASGATTAKRVAAEAMGVFSDRVLGFLEYLQFVGLSCETLKEFRWDVNELTPSSLVGGFFTKEIK